MQTRVMLLGDSWTHIMWNNRTYKDVFDQFGFADKVERGDNTAIGGTTASYWALPGNLSVIVNELQQNPSIDIVLLSIGGNDMLAGANGPQPGWHTGLSSTDESLLFDRIQNDIQTIINGIKSVRPTIEIVFSGYDYLNLVETVLNNPTGPTALLWLNLGQPNPLQINSAFARFEQRKVNIANTDPRVHYVQGFGLMQFVYGYPGYFPAYTVAPPGQQPPSYAPFPGGDPNYPTPPIALAGGGTDAIHLSDEGYKYLVVNQTSAYFRDKFRGGPNATFNSEGGLNDGWVRSDGNLGVGGIRTGDNASSNLYRGIVSFNTDAIPDNATITGASLFINRASSSGTNPFSSGSLGNAAVDVKTGTFGGAGIEITDYFDTADAADAGCFIGIAPNDGYTIRIDLQPAGFNSINKTGQTQFRIHFQIASGSGNDYIEFNNGNQPGLLAPYLDVFYSLPLTPASAEVYGDTTVICQGEGATINVLLTGTAPWSITWSDGLTEQNIQSTVHARTVNPDSTTSYSIVSISDANGAGTATGSALVEIVPGGFADAGEDTEICEGDSVELNATGGMNYLWSTGAATANIIVSPSQDEIYIAQVFNSFGCAESDTVEVFIKASPALPPLTIRHDTILTTINYAVYQWYADETALAGANNNFYIVNGPGDFQLEVTDSNGCASFSDTLTIDDWTIVRSFNFEGITIYPNPTDDWLFVNYKDGRDLKAVKVYNVMGELIFSKNNIEPPPVSINLTGFPSGVYFLKADERMMFKVTKR